MNKSVLDYFLSQGPTIFFMGLVNYFQYIYFTRSLKEKDAIIKSKDDKIEAMYEQVIAIVRQNLETNGKTNEIMTGLKGLLEIIRTDIKDKR